MPKIRSARISYRRGIRRVSVRVPGRGERIRLTGIQMVLRYLQVLEVIRRFDHGGR